MWRDILSTKHVRLSGHDCTAYSWALPRRTKKHSQAHATAVKGNRRPLFSLRDM
jgi:hypothetical protein